MKRGNRVTWIIAAGALVVALVLATGLGGDEPDPSGGSSPVAAAPSTTSGPTTTGAITTPPVTSITTSSTVATTTTTSPPVSTTTPSESPTTTLAPAEDPDAGVEQDSPVVLGEAVEVGDWRIGVSAADLDATETILDYVEFNDPPAEGSQYVLVELSGVYLGTGSIQPVLEWALVDDTVRFVPEGPECGVIPNNIYDITEVFAGDQFSANVCFEVPSENVTSDLVLTLGLTDETGREKFFALDAA